MLVLLLLQMIRPVLVLPLQQVWCGTRYESAEGKKAAQAYESLNKRF